MEGKRHKKLGEPSHSKAKECDKCTVQLVQPDS